MANISSLNLSSLYNQLTSFANLSNFWNRFDSVFGTSYDKAIAVKLLCQWKAKDFSQLPKIEVVSSTVLGNARAAYGTSTNTIYISDSFLKTSITTPSAIIAVLLEEIGHYIDAKINKMDTEGDEGEKFSNVVRGVTLSSSELTRIQNENDWGKITLNGKSITVEKAAPVVYETNKVASGLGSNIQFSGTNAIWSTSKSSNNVLSFFNGTTVAPIANSVYTNFDGYDISGSTIVYSKKGEIYRYSAGTTTKLTTNAINDYKPQIDGTNIVWYANDGTDVEIFRNNGTTTTQLTNNTSDEYDLEISGNYTTWVGWDSNDYEIYLNNGTTTTQVTNNTTDDYNPVISGNKIAWFNWNGSKENLFYYNGTTTSQITTNLEVYDPKLAGDKVVYVKYDGTNYSLQLYNATTKTTTQLSSNIRHDSFSSSYAKNNFQLDGNWVIWTEGISNSTNFTALKLYNGSSTVTLSSRLDSFSGQSQFKISNNKVVYLADASTGTFVNNGEDQLFLYDGSTTTPTTTQITVDSPGYVDQILSINGTSVLWSGNGLYLTKPSTKPILSINNVTVVEGQASPQNAVLTVTLSAVSTTPVTVQYATETNYSATNSAYSGSDYTETTGTLTFAAGQLTKTINVPILNDDNPESNETFTIKLSNVVGAVFVPGQNVGTVTITDTLQVSVTTTLPANVENLTLTGTANINGTGNTNANIIRGNSGNNILDGKGVTTYMGSNEQLIGGAGNDTYIVSGSFYTTITENLNEGTDTVQYFSVDSFGPFGNYTLGDNLENLTLTGTTGISGYGNTLNNVITGNSGNNFLDGGVGVDTVNYSNATAAVTVNLSTNSATGGGGSDTLFNFENVIGSNFNDTLIGSSGNNTLTGSRGKDALTGGLGSDRFDYKTLTNSLLGSTNNSFDVITDFNASTGNDLFLVTTARAGFTNAGAVATLDNAGIIAKLTTTNFAANFAAQFTFGTRTFVAINDTTAGFSATTDAIIEVTGLTGTLATSNFVIV
jgi:hypothetical protein